jgi:hypothetical protein
MVEEATALAPERTETEPIEGRVDLNDRWIGLKEASRLTGINYDTLQHRIKSGNPKFFKPEEVRPRADGGKGVEVLRSAVLQCIDETNPMGGFAAVHKVHCWNCEEPAEQHIRVDNWCANGCRKCVAEMARRHSGVQVVDQLGGLDAE